MSLLNVVWVASLIGQTAIPTHFDQSISSPLGTISPSTQIAPLAQTRRVGPSTEPVLTSLVPWTRDVKQQVRVWLPTVQVTAQPSKTGLAKPPTEGGDNLAEKAIARCSNGVLTRMGPSTSSPVKGYHVQVRGLTVAVLPTRKQADRLADQLHTVLDQDEIQANTLYPAYIDDRPGGMLGDRTLFTVEPATARALRQSADLIAIQWVNNLRQVFEESPLSLDDAQKRLYGLQPTPRTLEGIASWYGPYFHGRLTAAGETFDQRELTAAHPSLPFNTYLRVTNVKSGASVIVRINDRGPYVGVRSLDLSRTAARCIGSERRGVVPYEAVILKPGPVQTAEADKKPALLARAQPALNEGLAR